MYDKSPLRQLQNGQSKLTSQKLPVQSGAQSDAMTPSNPVKSEYDMLCSEYISFAKSKFATLQPEIAARNMRIANNDQYIYGDKLDRMLDIPLGHDKTPINWLRRTVEIHRSQFMGKGFSIDSTYEAEDITKAGDTQGLVASPGTQTNPQQQAQQDAEKKRLVIENEKRKQYAETRRTLIEAIERDNGGKALWEMAAENASAVGTSVIKAWYDEKEGKYKTQLVEMLENFYALWSKDDYRQHDCVAYVYQISKQQAVAQYGVSEDVQTSPLGSPLTILHAGNIAQYMSVQPMVTIMEITGKLEGWTTNGNGVIRRCDIGDETEINTVCVGNVVYSINDNEKYIPKYYILPNKLQRRRPWGVPDISEAAIQINLSYIETLSDWRTLSSKVNFPKWKAFGFPMGTQVPKPKPRAAEILPLSEGQDLQPLSTGQVGAVSEADFRNQMEELKNEFVREVGVSRQLFDMPDTQGNSNPALLTSMKSISDLTATKRNLWEPIIKKIYEDALHTLSEFDSNIKDIVEDESDWHINVSFPSALNEDDPNFHAMMLNQFNTGLISVQTVLEKLGYDKQEIDRIREEMEDPLTAAIHGHAFPQMAEYKLIPFGTPLPPKVNVNLRGDMTPEQEGNLSYQRGFNQGPFGTSSGPQGNSGLNAQDKSTNQGYTQGGKPGETAINKGPNGNTLPATNGVLPPSNAEGGEGGGFTAQGQGGGSPQLVNGPTANTSASAGIMSQPGSGAPATSAKGALNKRKQREGK